LQLDRCGPRIFLSWEGVACHLLRLGEGLEPSVFDPVSFYARSVSDLENFCCYGIVDLGLVILISWLFGRFVLNLINFSVSSEVNVSGLHVVF